jgi:glucose/arabinose dehydrogenase
LTSTRRDQSIGLLVVSSRDGSGQVGRLLGLTATVAIALAACAGASATPSSSTTPAPTPVLPVLSVANGTTIPVAIAVNGTVVETVAAGTTEDPLRASLPTRPWTVEARSPSGRVLATMTISVTDSISSTSGKLARADLACGRLDVWSGPPALGPMFIADPSKPCD